MIRRVLILLTLIVANPFAAFAQNKQEVAGELAHTYFGGMTDKSGHLFGFSTAALIGSLIFGSVGFVAFIFGKKNEEFRPMLLGIALMAYPYFVKQTLPMFAVGIILTAAVFVWRE